MKTFRCRCGSRVFFENGRCVACDRSLGYDPQRAYLLALEPAGDGSWSAADGSLYRYCRNHADYGVCNWLVPADQGWVYCLACRLNEVIPSLVQPERRVWWQSMEEAKRRLIYTLLALGLPVLSRQEDAEGGLAFAFLEDQRSNPLVPEESVQTGHHRGLITVNLAEAHAPSRESARVAMNEPYRTLLGHFRHESGHYYWDRLVSTEAALEEFRALFGDEREDYGAALERHYQGGQRQDWQGRYISAYAQAHPLEDWAESWAHYLHMVDTLETARQNGITLPEVPLTEFAQWLGQWVELTILMNELNRSMGLDDAYPFVLSDPVISKLHYVHRAVTDLSPSPIGSAATDERPGAAARPSCA